MLALLTGTTALVAHSPLTVTRSAVAFQHTAAPLGRADAPVMILPPVVRGAVIGGAAVGLVKTFLERQPKTYTTGEADVTKADVMAAQKLWADSIASISKVYADKGDYVEAAGDAAGKLYGYGNCDVLFKPTKSTKNPFRPTGESAMSYFVGSEAMNDAKYKGEDAGFAINGGRGWSNVVFNNHKIDLNGPTAQAMGDYTFTDATSGDKVNVYYTFGYKRNDDGKVRIYLHHSSVPYSP